MIGPLEYRSVPAGGPWVAIAAQLRLPSGEVLFDVHLETVGGYPYGPVGGTRIPPGSCYHRHPDAEIARLIKLVDWPAPYVPDPVVFADFDGVLNNSVHFAGLRKGRTENDVLVDAESFDLACVERLNTIVEATDAQLVISSSWRSHFMLSDLRGILQRHGFRGTVISKTPSLTTPEASRRGDEVQAWLTAHRHEGAYVILDDIANMGHLAGQLVQTSAATGLTDADVAHAIELLRKANDG